MAASVQFRPQNRDLGMVMREVDEDLAIFLGMRPSSEKERMNDFNDSNEAKSDGSLILKAVEPETVSTLEADDNLDQLEVERNDYDWLLSQTDASLLPLEEINPAINHYQASNGDDGPLKSEVDNTVEEFTSQSGSSVKLPVTASADSSAPENRRPSSLDDRKPGRRRSATPTGRPSLREKPKPSRSSTPTPRATLPSSKPMAPAQSRSSTPGKSVSHASAPSFRPGQTVLPSSKPAARTTTPTRTPQLLPGRTSVVKNPVSSSGISTTVKSKLAKPSEILSLSHDSSQNLKSAIVRRPASASRGRPAAQATNSASSNGKPRQKSCSPAKVRAPPTTANKPSNKILMPKSRGLSCDGDEVNPVLIGTKMVNRVVNMRKLAPPKQNEYMAHDNHRKSCHENSGFGRSLSKSSLDMAIRHMDIGRSVGDTTRPVAVASGGLSSGRSNRTSSSKNGAISVLESPPLSRSNSSKSSSVYLSSHILNGTELDY